MDEEETKEVTASPAAAKEGSMDPAVAVLFLKWDSILTLKEEHGMPLKAFLCAKRCFTLIGLSKSLDTAAADHCLAIGCVALHANRKPGTVVTWLN